MLCPMICLLHRNELNRLAYFCHYHRQKHKWRPCTRPLCVCFVCEQVKTSILENAWAKYCMGGKMTRPIPNGWASIGTVFRFFCGLTVILNCNHLQTISYLAPTNSSHSSIRFHCRMVSKGVKSRLRALSPVHDDGKMTFCCLPDADIITFWHTLDFIQNNWFTLYWILLHVFCTHK